MAYGRNTAQSTRSNSWYQEQMGLINTASATELRDLQDGFDESLATVTESIRQTYGGVNVFKDAKRIMENEGIMM